MPAVQRLPARYKHVTQLTEGGVGRVELALRRDGEFERLYAVKRLHRRFADDDDFRSMFVDEAKLAGLIRHPNVVPVVDVGEDSEGPFLVMEYIEGPALSAVIKGLGEPAPIQVALRMVAQAARGLHAAHELRGHDGDSLHVVHRDVSPQNILVGFDGNVLVTDFGIAKALGRSTKTATGILKGKFGYMSPEQLRFERVDRRADLFSLGIVLFELLTGQRLYQSLEDHDGLHRILHEPPPDVGLVRPEIPAEVVQLLFEMLAKEPEKRPTTAEQIAVRLEEAAANLAEDEGLFEIRYFMQEHFSGLRTAHAAKLENAIRVAAAPSEHPEGEPAPVPDDSRSTETVIATVPGRSRIRSIAITVAIAAAVGAGAWIARSRLTDQPRADRSHPTQNQGPEQSIGSEPRATRDFPAARNATSSAITPREDRLGGELGTGEIGSEALQLVTGRDEAGDPDETRRARRRARRARRNARRTTPNQPEMTDIPVPTVAASPAPTPEPADTPPRSSIPSLGWDDR